MRHANASQPVAVDGIVQLGGHRQPRTRTPTRGANVGMALMRAQIAAVEGIGTFCKPSPVVYVHAQL